MGLLKEPLDVDFYVDPKSLSGTEEKIISDYIKADKEKIAKQKNRRTRAAYRKKITTA